MYNKDYMKEHCDVKNCEQKVFAVGYPEDLNYKLCFKHFNEWFGKIAQEAEIVETND